MNKKERARRAARRARQDVDVMEREPIETGGTPETIAKLQPDPLQKMVQAGLIDSGGERAAEEIKCVYLAICRDVVSKNMQANGTARGRYRMSEELDRAHAETYLPWTRENRKSAVESTIDLCVDRKDPMSSLAENAIAHALMDYARRMLGAKRVDRVA